VTLAFPLAVALALVATPATEHYAFGAERDWVVLDSSGAIVRRLAVVHPALPEDVRDAAVSRDGKRLAVAAFSPAAENVMLYLWDLEAGSVVQVGEKQGFHAAPSFSADGKWLTFAHHATLGGPVGMHEAREYAQLYRQELEEGAPAEALTSNDGCHMESFSRSGAPVYLAHADCKGGRRIEVLREDAGVTLLSDFVDRHGEPSLSADGRWLVVSKVVGDSLEIVELNASEAGKRETLWKGTRKEFRIRPRYLGASRDVVFQNGLAIIRILRKSGNEAVVVGRVR